MALVIVSVVVLDLCMAFFFWTLEFSFSAQARGEAESWAAAGGFQLGPFTASAVAARGVTPRAELLAFGRCLRRLPSDAEETPEAEADADEDPALERAKRAVAQTKRAVDILERRIGLVELFEFGLGERRRIRVERLDLDLEYSFRDVIFTGKLLAALSVLSALVPPPVAIRHSPSWQWEDRLNASLAGTISLRPGRLLVDSLWFVVRNIRIWPRRVPAP